MCIKTVWLTIFWMASNFSWLNLKLCWTNIKLLMIVSDFMKPIITMSSWSSYTELACMLRVSSRWTWEKLSLCLYNSGTECYMRENVLNDLNVTVMGWEIKVHKSYQKHENLSQGSILLFDFFLFCFVSFYSVPLRLYMCSCLNKNVIPSSHFKCTFLV